MRRLIARPATMILSDPDGYDNVTVCLAAYLSNEHEVENTVELEGEIDIKLVDIDTIDVSVPNLLTGTSSPLGLQMVVRATMEDDAVALPSLPGYPLPVPVIIGSITGENMDTHIEALVEDDGYVSTLLLVTDMGLYTRYSRTWIRLADIDLIDGINSIEVYDGAVDVYDTADDVGQQVHIDGLPREGRDAVGLGELYVAASAPRTFNPDGDSIVAAALTAAFDADLHPRGKDGKFITKFGLIKLFGKINGPDGESLDGQRGVVHAIVPDSNDPGNPTIQVNIPGPDGKPKFVVNVKPSNVEAAPEKARLDKPIDLRPPWDDPDSGAPTPPLDLRPPWSSEAGQPNTPEPARTAPPARTGPSALAKAQAQVDKDQAEVDRIDAAMDALRPSQFDQKEKLRQDRSRAWSFLNNSQAALDREKAAGVNVPGGPNNTTISTEESAALADQVMSGSAINVNPPDLDDVINHFADSPDPVDLTLLTQFASMRGSGIPRSEMPQIPKEHLGTFQDKLRADGFSFEPDLIDPSELQATQAELDGKNVSGMMRSARAGTFDMLADPIWISNDGHVLDGHHRWAALTALSTNCSEPGCVMMPVIRVDMPMDQLLAYANQFNDDVGVKRLGFGTSRPQSTADFSGPVAASGVPEPDENGYFKMVTDAEDGVLDEDLANLPHGDGSAFPGFTSGTDTVTASIIQAELPVIDTPDQLLAALETARDDESLRWYVERRAQALGVEVELPWR